MSQILLVLQRILYKIHCRELWIMMKKRCNGPWEAPSGIIGLNKKKIYNSKNLCIKESKSFWFNTRRIVFFSSLYYLNQKNYAKWTIITSIEKICLRLKLATRRNLEQWTCCKTITIRKLKLWNTILKSLKGYC